MQITASLNNLRISPRKVRLVAGLLKNRSVNDARQQLLFLSKQATQPIKKLLDSAVANAKHNYKISVDELKLKQILVNEGYTLKRWLPRAHGRATQLKKRSSRVTLVLVSSSPVKVKSNPGSTKPPIKSLTTKKTK